MQIEAFRGKGPKLVLEEFFSVPVTAWGLFQDRFGTVRRQFRVQVASQYDGRDLTLTEDFVYDDGETERRVWTVRRTGAETVVGTCKDVIGQARGRIVGNALNWTYDFNLSIHGRKVQVRFNDWMFLQADGVMLNKATVTKMGVRLGEAMIFFRRDEAAAAQADGLRLAASE